VDKSITSRQYSLFLRELRAARKQAGITQFELAVRIGESQSFVSKCERGERRLDIIEVRAFCAAFGLPFPTFIDTLETSLRARSPESTKKRLSRR
jgi:transcriptional regulator with XRE-family HTH domain